MLCYQCEQLHIAPLMILVLYKRRHTAAFPLPELKPTQHIEMMGPHCRCPRRIMAILLFFGLIGLVFLALHAVDLLGQYRTYDYVFELLRDPVIPSSDVATANLRPEEPEDKIIVVAKLEKEETDWIKEFLPE